MSTEREHAFVEAADYLRDAARTAAQAQRAHDLAEGLPLIGTSTANEVEWYQIGNWAHSMLTALIAREHNETPSADDVARGALDPVDYERLTGEIRAAKTDERDAGEAIELEIEFEKHRPVLSMRGGSIAGCQCMDRVFYRDRESWGAHLLDVADTLLGLSAEPDVSEEANHG